LCEFAGSSISVPENERNPGGVIGKLHIDYVTGKLLGFSVIGKVYQTLKLRSPPMSPLIPRRQFLAGASASLLSVSCQAATPASEDTPKPKGIGLGFSLYGMKSLPLEKALSECAKIGYDCVELALMPGFHADPLKLSVDDLKRLREGLSKGRLRVAALMENLPLLAADKQHEENLNRLEQASEFAVELNPEHPPLIETVLGGKPAEWADVRGRMVERLAAWVKVAERSKTVLAIKGHVGNAAHLPEHVVWLVEQVKSPWVKAAFDYSHYELRGLGLEKSLKTLLPHTAFVHVKDARGEPGKFEFLLPGAGKTDYAAYFKLLAELGYQGDVVVEVSGQIHSRPDYDPVAAARRSYEALAPVLEKSGARRK
jgi:sugar phosphate isomerase/epimerase